MRVILTIWMLFFLASDAHSQIVNTSSNMDSLAKDGLAGSLEMSSTKTTGNSETFILDSVSSLSYRQGDTMVMGMHKRVQGVSGREAFSDATFMHLRGRQYFNEQWSVEVFAQKNRNPFRSLSNREILGAGPRLELSDGLAFGFALMKEIEEYSGNRHTDAYRYSMYIDCKYVWDDVVTFNQIAYYQPRDSGTSNLFSLFDQTDERLLSETGFKIQIGKDWYFKLAYRVESDTAPEEGVAKVDTYFKNTLSFVF